MEQVRASLLAGFLLVAAAACNGVDEQHGDGPDSVAATADSAARSADAVGGDHSADSGKPDGHEARGHTAAGEKGQALLPIMQRLGSEMTTLTHGLMTDDHATVTRSAAAIAEHAPISAEELERIHRELGAEIAVFNAIDDSVHKASVRLHEAARARQLGQVVNHLAVVQRGCVSCHTQFRARLRTTPAGNATPR